MPESNEEKAKTFDPFEPFREMRDAYLDAMSKTMIESVNSEAYAKASGAMLDWSLTATVPFRESKGVVRRAPCAPSPSGPRR